MAIRPVRLDPIAFDQGIDRITRTNGDANQRMPGNSELPPAEMGVRSELESLIQQKSLADHALDTLKPQLINRSVLIPSEFKAGLSNAADTLNKAAAQLVGEKSPRHNRTHTGTDQKSRAADASALRRASSTLSDARKLIDENDERRRGLVIG